MIVMYKGKRGAGKTLTMVKDGMKFLERGWRVLRNFEVGYGDYIDNEQILALDKNSDIKDCVIMIDEIQIFFDSRRSMASNSKNFSNFIQQIRKRNIVLLCTTQYANTVDLRLRQHIDILAKPKFYKDLEVCEVTYIDVTSLEDDQFNMMEPDKRVIVYDARNVYPLYDTSEMIV